MPPATLFAIVCAVVTPNATLPVANPPVSRAQDVQAVPNWIWHGSASNNQEVIFRKHFQVTGTVSEALLVGSCDNQMTVLVNGEQVASHDKWEQLIRRNVAKALKTGDNLIEVRASNQGNVAGLALSLTLEEQGAIVTDASWKGASPEHATANEWSNVTVIGRVGTDGLPWNSQVGIADFRALLTSNNQPLTTQAVQQPTGMTLPDGFRAELIYQVPKESQGSWVSMCKDDKGRLYASDQGKRGIYRIT
ncbi:MAG: hypothetical protein ACI9F9_002084, partial [Candidatus Paceibacteria bacterium]